MKCMETNFGECDHSRFGVMAPFCLPSKTAKISLRTMGVKKWNRLKKFMQVEVDVKCMETKFGGHSFSGFGVMAPFCLPSKTANIVNRGIHVRHVWWLTAP